MGCSVCVCVFFLLFFSSLVNDGISALFFGSWVGGSLLGCFVFIDSGSFFLARQIQACTRFFLGQLIVICLYAGRLLRLRPGVLTREES